MRPLEGDESATERDALEYLSRFGG